MLREPGQGLIAALADDVGCEASAEVAGGGGVGDAIGLDGVEEDEVVASQFDVVEASAVAEGVVGEVEDVIGLVVGEVELGQVEPLVDDFGEAELADERLDGADAAVGDRAGLGSDLVMDVGRGDDRIRRGLCDGSMEPATDLAGEGFCVCLRRDVGVEWFSLEISL